jgi:glycosyltransferase involved in cell wall biosynthesis
VPRKSVTALRLGWRQLRRLRSLPGFLRLSYHTSFTPVSIGQSQGWRSRFGWKTFASRIGQGAAGLFNRKPTVYRAPIPAAHGLIPRPRILHAIANVFVGGSTQLIYDVCSALGEQYEMRIVTSAVPRGGHHRGVPITVVPQPASIERLGHIIAAFAPHVLHVHYWGDVDRPWYEAVIAAAKSVGTRVVLNVNTPVAPLVDPAIVQTVYVSRYVQARFGSHGETERVIHPGIDLDKFEAPQTFDDHAYDSIGMIYRLSPDKLNAESIEIFIDVCKARPQTRVVIVGDGELFESFVNRTLEEGVRGNFLFAGAVPYDRLPEFYRLFKVFVAPVWQESFGQVTPFAMSMGIAVAGNRIGALPEILHSEATLGASRAETVARILDLLGDRMRVDALGRSNRELARSLYCVRAMTDAYAAMYGDVLGRNFDLMPGFPPARVYAGQS